MLDISKYNFSLPSELIANEPATPRDSSRLFIYDTSHDKIMFDTFKHIHKFLPKNAFLVFNDTKVLPARLLLKKETGGKIEVLLMVNEHRPNQPLIKGIVDRKITVGAKLYFHSGAFLEVRKQEEQFFYFQPSVSFSELVDLLYKEGLTPIPPYIKGSTLSESSLRKRYQSTFAKHPASVAAPTASLHFTPRVFTQLEQQGMSHAFATLHVGSGTFAPITENNIVSKSLFAEHCEISTREANSINRALANNAFVIPVGTTAMRTLESFATPYNNNYHVAPGAKETNIFIFPPYKFTIASGLLTNFHIPQSSLLLLVDAFLEYKKSQRRILDLYKVAIDNKFRFYSFGDAMLIL